jgi:hypothetical protein
MMSQNGLAFSTHKNANQSLMVWSFKLSKLSSLDFRTTARSSEDEERIRNARIL